jgi:hypothetical protein
LNKSTKIWLNYVVGGAISLFLLWCIYLQVKKQLAGIDSTAWQQTGPGIYLLMCIALMFINTSLEGHRWHRLARSVEPMSYSRAFSSYLAGVAFAVITPNRIGEYPGRILYLGRQHTFRYINVSILGVLAQLWGIYLFGLGALIYYNIAFPAPLAKVALCLCMAANVLAAIFYFRFESWLPLLEKVKWLRKFAIYGKLVHRIDKSEQIRILTISLVRFAIFTAQYLILLKWMNVNISPVAGFGMAALFFWVIAVIPSIALTELGVRGSVSIFLFQHFSTNTVGILAATAGIWILNLIVPAIIGSILIARMRLLRLE